MSKDVSKLIDFDDTVEKLTDRTAEIRGTLGKLTEAWSFDLKDRKPGVAYVDENGVPVTDLDLACFLSALVDRRAVINLPMYKARRAATHTEGQYVVGASNRHGRLTGLTSNQEVFSFGISIEDANVIVASPEGGEDIGAHRSLMLQDLDGTWHEGWENIVLLPAGLDKEVFDQLSGTAKILKFKYMVHPNRWPSFYGKPHLLALLADARLKDEMKFLNSEVKRLKETLAVPPTVWPKHETVGESEPKPFLAFEAKVDGTKAELHGEYTPFDTTSEGLQQAITKQKRYRQLQGQLRFQYRATQFAFVKEALIKNIPQDQLLDWLSGTGSVQPRMPSWVAGKQWERGWKEGPKARTYWARIELVEGLWLRFRTWMKTERVAKE